MLELIVELPGLGQAVLHGDQVFLLGLQGLARLEHLRFGGQDALLPIYRHGRLVGVTAHQKGPEFDDLFREVLGDLLGMGLVTGGGLGGGLVEVLDIGLEGDNLVASPLEALLEVGLDRLGLVAQLGEGGIMLLLLGLHLGLEIPLALDRGFQVPGEGGQFVREIGVGRLGGRQGLALLADRGLMGLNLLMGVLLVPDQERAQANDKDGQKPDPGAHGRGNLRFGHLLLH